MENKMEQSGRTIWPYPPAIKPAKQFTWREAAVSMAIVTFVAAIIMPVFTICRESGNRPSCFTNARQSGVAVLMYAQDYGDRYPVSDWMDATHPYLADWARYACTKVLESNPNDFGLAFESSLLGVPTGKTVTQENRVLIYDSSMLYKNAVAPFRFGIARPGRHNDKNNIGFVDGHVRCLSVAETTSLYH
jgi:prepilin-type processing-associated H-X9-DG protein